MSLLITYSSSVSLLITKTSSGTVSLLIIEGMIKRGTPNISWLCEPFDWLCEPFGLILFSNLAHEWLITLHKRQGGVGPLGSETPLDCQMIGRSSLFYVGLN